MKPFTVLPKNPYFEVLGGLAAENASDEKVCFANEVDMSSAVTLRKQIKALTGIKPSYTTLMVKAVALALQRFPYANRVPIRLPFRSRIVQMNAVDVNVAVEYDRPGYEQLAFAGTVRNADRLALPQITTELRDLSNATPDDCNRLKQFTGIIEKLPRFLSSLILSMPRWSPGMWAEHRGGSVLISSPAKYGVDALLAHWVWPLGFSFGYVKDRPIVVNGKLTVRPTTTITMSFNRLIMGGAPAARFFKHVQDLLENAETTLGPTTTPVSKPEPLVEPTRKK